MTLEPTPSNSGRLPPRWVQAFLLLLGLFLVVRLVGLTWLMSVNVPFSDQWAVLRSLEDGFQWSDVLTAFRWQHGPHRQGLSFAMVLPAYHLSHWSVRLDSLLMVGEQLLAGLLVLRLRQRLIPGPWQLRDALLLLVFWGACAFETVTVAPNASHSIFPLMLLMLFANVWIAPLGPMRLVLLAGLVLALTFTGFGITAIPVVAFVLVVQVMRLQGTRRLHAAVLLVACAISLGLFLVDYHFVVAADGFQAMRPNPLDYLDFVVAMYSHFTLMLHRAPRWLLFPVGALLVAALVVAGLRCFRGLLAEPQTSGSAPADRQLHEICLILIGCSLAFALLTAYGRVQLGVAAATASRYTALLMPGVGALVLLLMRSRAQVASTLLGLLLLLFLVRVVPETRQAWLQSRYYASMKMCWLESYRSTRDFEAANAQVRQLDGFKTFQDVWLGEPGTWQMLAEQGLGPFAAGNADAPFLKLYPRPCEVLQAP